MTTIDPITCPVPVIRIGQGSGAPTNKVPARITQHYSSTVSLAPVGMGRIARRSRRWMRDARGAKQVARAQRRADSAYRIARNWSESDALEEEIEQAWAKWERAEAKTTTLRGRHLRRCHRRTGLTTITSSFLIGVAAWQLATMPLAYDALAIGGVVLAGSYGLGLMGRREQGRADGRQPHRQPNVLEFVSALDVHEAIEVPPDDPLQLLRDIMSTREHDGEPGAWTSVIINRLQDPERFGDRYAGLTVERLRDHLRNRHRITTRKVRMTDAEGESRPLAGFYFETQINAALKAQAA